MSVYSELKIQLYRYAWRNPQKASLHWSPLVVQEPVNANSGYHDVVVEQQHTMTLHQLLTQIVQGMEALGVEFTISPAQPARPTGLSVSLKQKEQS